MTVEFLELHFANSLKSFWLTLIKRKGIDIVISSYYILIKGIFILLEELQGLVNRSSIY